MVFGVTGESSSSFNPRRIRKGPRHPVLSQIAEALDLSKGARIVERYGARFRVASRRGPKETTNFLWPGVCGSGYVSLNFSRWDWHRTFSGTDGHSHA